MLQMMNVSEEANSLDALHEQSAKLILHANRLRQDSTELRDASKLLRGESIQLRDDCSTLRSLAKRLP